VLAVIGDTHGTDDHRLSGAVLSAVRRADLVVHTGDFTTLAVLEAIEGEAARLAAVTGNNDAAAIRERLPATRVVEALDRRLLVVHGHDHGETALSLLARQEDADAVVVGHSHDPTLADVGGLTLVNPGSYADPRWHRPAYATVEHVDGGVRVTLRSPDGEAFDAATL
jgi:putative phosphoesterase